MEDRVEKLLSLVPALRGQPVTVTALSGGITNRNYRIDTVADHYVLRLAGDQTDVLGIDRTCEYACSEAAATAGVGAEVITFLPGHGALLTRFLDGSVLTPEGTQQREVLRRVVTSLRRYHDSPPGKGEFSPFATVRNYHALARHNGVPFASEIGEVLQLMDRIEAALPSIEPPCPCHNDLLPANFIDDGTIVRIVDWEYAGMGDRFFDLGNLAANHRFTAEQERALLLLYFGKVEPESLRRLRLMRLASDLREAMWGFLQSGISTLAFDFTEYGEIHLHRFLDGFAAANTDVCGSPAPARSSQQ